VNVAQLIQLHGKMSCLGNFAIREVRKIRNGKLLRPACSFNSKYVLMIISASVKKGKVIPLEARCGPEGG